MIRIKAILLKAYRKFMRRFCYLSYKNRLINKTPTVISSDCVGGVICSNLGLKFNSPTVNLYFSKKDFWEFVKNLEYYLTCELIEKKDSDKSYPVGTLTYNDREIAINFMHYHDFEEAKNKWNERKKRIDFSNIYIIQLIQTASEDDIKEFDSLPYKNKMLITGENLTNSENVITHKILLKEDYRPGEILEYKSQFAPKRHIDDINYVEFLNSGRESEI